jgi:hypothetical protein
MSPGCVCDRQAATPSAHSREAGRRAGAPTGLNRYPYEALPEPHVVVISQV